VNLQFIDWPQTLRWPTSVNPDATTQSSVVVSQLDSNQPQMKQRLYTLFTNYNNYMNVSNEAWIASAGPGSYDSFESVHDQIHGTTGGPNYGDMSIIDVSAFDPVFWMHHA
jgi:tyrosinase